MKCADCRHKRVLELIDGSKTWVCGQSESPHASQIVPEDGGCPWRDQDDQLAPLYHVASGADVPSIRKAGLIPSIGKRSADAGETGPAVYFFRTPEDAETALMSWLGDEFPEDEPLYMVTAMLPSSYASAIAPGAGYEAVCNRPIPPDYLDIQDLDEWTAWARKGGAVHA